MKKLLKVYKHVFIIGATLEWNYGAVAQPQEKKNKRKYTIRLSF